MDQIQRLYEQKNYGLAFQKAKLLIDEMAENYRLNYLMGLILNAMGESYMAENYFSISLEFNPEFEDCLKEMGQTLYRNEKSKEAKDTFEKILAKDQRNPLANYYMGRINDDLNQFDQALRFYNRCISADPAFKGCKKRLKKLQTKMERTKDLDELSEVDLKKKILDLQQIIGQKEYENICAVCLAQEPIYANIVCGHCCVCKSCLPLIAKKCPICNCVSSYIRIYIN